MAIDSRLSPAKVCWRQTVVFSNFFAGDNQLKYIDVM